MTKSKIISTALLLITIIIAIFLPNKLLKQYNINSDLALFSFVPIDASIIFEVHALNDFKQSVSTKTYMQELQNISVFKKLTQDITAVDKLFHESKMTNHLLSEGQFLTTVQIDAPQQIDFLHIIKFAHDTDDLQQLLNTWKKGGTTVTTYIFEGYTVTELSSTLGKFSICMIKDVLLISSSNILIEKSLSEIENPKGNISKQKDFVDVRSKTGKNAVCSVYINLETLPNLISNFTNNKEIEVIQQIANWGSWIGLDFSLQENGFGLNGYFVPNKQNTFFNNIKKEEVIDSFKVESILPDNTAYSLSISSEDFRQWMNPKNKNHKEFEASFLSWMGKSLTYVVTEPLTTNFKNNQFWVAEVNNYELAVQRLESLRNINGALPTENYPPYIFKNLLTNDLYSSIIGKNFNPVRNPYYAFINKNYVVFANDATALASFMEQINFNQTLSQNIIYQQFKSKNTQVSSINQYVNLSNCFHLINAFLKEDVKEKWAKDFQYFEKIKPIAIRLTPYNNMQVVNVRAVFDEKGKQPTSVIWRSELNANAIMPPVVVKNHYTGENEIFVQDSAFRIYLMNKNGKILWSKQLESNILSEIFQVDYYKNNKLQYLFNTKSNIHLVDRNGNDVKAFPRKLRVPATNGLTPYNFEKNNLSLLFVAGKDSCIYGFKKDGSPLSYWNPGYKTGLVTKPIQHIKADGNNYLLAINTEGTVHIIQEDGMAKVQPIKFEVLHSDIVFEQGENSNRIVAVDSKGKGYVTNLDGKQFNLKMSVGKNEQVKFCFADVVGDERKDYVILSDKELAVYYYDDDNTFRLSHNVSFLNKQQDVFPVRLKHHPKAFIGTVSTENNEISLLDNDVRLIKDFPLAGSTRFTITDLYDDGKKILVVANDNLIYTYRLSYITN